MNLNKYCVNVIKEHDLKFSIKFEIRLCFRFHEFNFFIKIGQMRRGLILKMWCMAVSSSQLGIGLRPPTSTTLHLVSIMKFGILNRLLGIVFNTSEYGIKSPCPLSQKL